MPGLVTAWLCHRSCKVIDAGRFVVVAATQIPRSAKSLRRPSKIMPHMSGLLVLYNIPRSVVSRHLKSAMISGKQGVNQEPLAGLVCEGASSGTDEGLADKLLHLYELAASERCHSDDGHDPNLVIQR
ncbi:hypothetical protein KCU89_g153, partial [Aureobasidium melanogenum]